MKAMDKCKWVKSFYEEGRVCYITECGISFVHWKDDFFLWNCPNCGIKIDYED